MRRGWTIFSGVFLGLLIAEILILSPGEEGKKDDPAAPGTATAPTQDQMLRGVRLVETREGRKEWELEAADAMSIKDQGDWKLTHVKAQFFDKKGNPSFRVSGERGTVSTKTKDMKISGNVVVESASGYHIETDNVLYDSKSELLSSQEKVHMYDMKEPKGTRLDLIGMGFNGLVQDGFIDILKDVTVRRGLKDGRIVNVKSERARFHEQDRSANFSGQVKVDVGSWRVTGPEARFLYDGLQKVITQLEVVGGIRLSDLDKWATAQRFTMSFLADQYTLNGAPRLVQDNDELRGDEIVLFDSGKRIQVRKARATVESEKN